MNTSSLAVTVDKVSSRSAISASDWVAVEEPLEIRLGYSTPSGHTASSVSITMRTPGNDAELALGFLYTESIIHSPDDVTSVTFLYDVKLWRLR